DFPQGRATLRGLRIFFGLVASAMLLAGICDVLLHGTLSLVPRPVLASLLGVVIVFVLHAYLAARQRNELLNRQAAQLQAVAGRLQSSLSAAAAAHTQPHHSEA